MREVGGGRVLAERLKNDKLKGVYFKRSIDKNGD